MELKDYIIVGIGLVLIVINIIRRIFGNRGGSGES